MSFFDIESSLNAVLEGFSQTSGIRVAWENRDFSPREGVLDLRQNFMPGTPRAAALGPDAMDYVRGTYQVTVRGKSGRGRAGAKTVAEDVRNAFPRGLKLTRNGTETTVESVGIGPGVNNGDRYTVPVSITFFAYMPPV